MSDLTKFPSRIFYKTVTIPEGSDTSDFVNLNGGLTLSGLTLPNSMTGTTLKIQSSDDRGHTFQDVYNKDGNRYDITVGSANRKIGLVPQDCQMVDCFRVVSSSAEASDRAIVCVLRPLV